MGGRLVLAAGLALVFCDDFCNGGVGFAFTAYEDDGKCAAHDAVESGCGVGVGVC